MKLSDDLKGRFSAKLPPEIESMSADERLEHAKLLMFGKPSEHMEILPRKRSPEEELLRKANANALEIKYLLSEANRKAESASFSASEASRIAKKANAIAIASIIVATIVSIVGILITISIGVSNSI